MDDSDPGLQAARAAKRKALRAFEGLARVAAVGVALEGGRYVVRVSLEAEPDPGVALPREIDGVPVTIRVVGPIRAR